MISDSILNEWQEAINDMSYEELQRSLEDSCYYQEYKELVKRRMVEIEKGNAHVQEVFLKTLKSRRYKYELGKDQNVFYIKYKRKIFRADLYCEENAVEIAFIHGICVDKEDVAKLSRLKEAINATNIICGVTTFYDKKKDDNNIVVLSKGIINFVLDNPNFEMELGMILNDCLSAQYVVKEFMKKNKRKKLDNGEATT